MIRYATLSARHRSIAIATLIASALIAGPASGAIAASAPTYASHGYDATAISSSVPTLAGLTASQRQAVLAAKNYLNLESGFSYKGLLDQLTSQYGSGFSKKDATAALKSMKINWKKQAVLAAQNYLDLDTGFSRAGLIEQLTSPYGGQFTKAQAKYAVAKVGL